MAKRPATQWREDAVTLDDGRRLAYVDAGAPGGRPLFWFHGLPGGRWQLPPPAISASVAHGVRLICVSRPGVGGSSRNHRASLLSFAADVAALADALEIDRYAVAGLSAGSPYALACAYRDPERVVAASLLGGVVPITGINGRARSSARLLSLILQQLRPGHPYLAAGLDLGAPIYSRLVPAIFSLYCRLGPRHDRPILNRPDMHHMFGTDFLRAVREGISGFLYDAAIISAPWGFNLRDVIVPLRIWHGDIDPLVPLAEAANLAGEVPNGELMVLPGLGHYAGLVEAAEVIADLAAIWAEKESAR